MNILYLLVTEFVFLVNAGFIDYKFVPTLPVGEFRLDFKGINVCNTNPNSNILQNFYLSRIAENTYVQKGNLTLKKPLDDSFFFRINLTIKDSIGGWKENAHLMRFPTGCSSYKSCLGPVWKLYLGSFGISNLNCPIAKGVYVSKGYDLIQTKDVNFSKVFFYGTYRCLIYFTDKYNNEHGCVSYTVDVKRPWEV